MNRKLIRPNLTEVKDKERYELSSDGDGRQFASDNNRRPQNAPRRAGAAAPSLTTARNPNAAAAAARNTSFSDDENQETAASKNKRLPPPPETNAEIYYYKKQIDAHTPMVIVLQDNEEIEGTIEWYDRHALKVNRKTLPNIMLLKHNIKYMFKAEERGGRIK